MNQLQLHIFLHWFYLEICYHICCSRLFYSGFWFTHAFTFPILSSTEPLTLLPKWFLRRFQSTCLQWDQQGCDFVILQHPFSHLLSHRFYTLPALFDYRSFHSLFPKSLPPEFGCFDMVIYVIIQHFILSFHEQLLITVNASTVITTDHLSQLHNVKCCFSYVLPW